MREFPGFSLSPFAEEDAKVNLAITLERLGKDEQAIPLWRELYRSTNDPNLREKIETDID